jgi:hypothetical protein
VGIERTREGVPDHSASGIDLHRIGIPKEDDSDCEHVLGFESSRVVESEPLRFGLEKRLREGSGQTRPISGIATHATTMFHALESDHSLSHNFSRGLPICSCNAANSTGVTTDVVRVQKLSAEDSLLTAQLVHRRSHQEVRGEGTPSTDPRSLKQRAGARRNG